MATALKSNLIKNKSSKPRGAEDIQISVLKWVATLMVNCILGERLQDQVHRGRCPSDGCADSALRISDTGVTEWITADVVDGYALPLKLDVESCRTHWVDDSSQDKFTIDCKGLSLDDCPVETFVRPESSVITYKPLYSIETFIHPESSVITYKPLSSIDIGGSSPRKGSNKQSLPTIPVSCRSPCCEKCEPECL